MTSTVQIRDRSVWHSSPKTMKAVLGVGIRTNPQPIARHCLGELAAVSEDIATIAECAALADRMFTRRRSVQWARSIELEIPVYEHRALSESKTIAALHETLSFLTGDDWKIAFVPRTDARPVETFLPLGVEKQSVIPFSDGLDSFALCQLMRNSLGREAVLPLQVGYLQRGDAGLRARPLRVPRGFRMGHPREQSYRTRPFVYFSIAAIACSTIRGDAVWVGENGQGALGPSFAKFADEWPFRSTHPAFLSRLSVFLSSALQGEVRFRQPHLWRTKGEVIAELLEKNPQLDWQHTQSCSQRPLQRRMRKACGFCGGCLLRRVSIAAASLPAEENHAFECASSDLALIDHQGVSVQMSLSDRQILARAAMSMSLFARADFAPDFDEAAAREVREIAGAHNRKAVEDDLRSLIRRHRAEWEGFLLKLPDQAWLKQQFLM